MDKQQQLIETAFKLFYKEGVNATGINRILAESGIAKKTLYHYFSSKNELILATVKYRDRIFNDWLRNRMAAVPIGEAALYEMFSALDDWFNNRVESMKSFQGCYFINIVAEFSAEHNSIRSLCVEHKKNILRLIAHHVDHCCDEDQDGALITDKISLLKEGAIIQASVLGDLSSAIKAKSLLPQILEKSSRFKKVAIPPTQ